MVAVPVDLRGEDGCSRDEIEILGCRIAEAWRACFWSLIMRLSFWFGCVGSTRTAEMPFGEWWQDS
jgi:hypothetical protein